MSKIDKTNYIHTLEETLHVLGVVRKVLMQDRVANRAEINNIVVAIRSIEATLAVQGKKKQRARREEQQQRQDEQRQKKLEQRLQQLEQLQETEDNGEAEV